jgi:hypothetical protein
MPELLELAVSMVTPCDPSSKSDQLRVAIDREPEGLETSSHRENQHMEFRV